MNSDPVVILAARRTPIAPFKARSPHHGPAIGSAAIKAALADSGWMLRRSMKSSWLRALGRHRQAPARQAASAPAFREHPGHHRHKMCGSAMRA